jgi:DNA-binding response OmpR family regulator
MHILLVEDHEDTRTGLLRLLTLLGYQVSTAESVRTALNVLGAIQLDTLISDIGLPDGTGFELVAEAKKQQGQQGLKAVALTALTADADRQRGFEAGFDEYLGKPLNFQRLQAVLGPPG